MESKREALKKVAADFKQMQEDFRKRSGKNEKDFYIDDWLVDTNHRLVTAEERAR